MAGRRDYYEVLGVPRDADAKTIKSAFRVLARRYHLDISTEPDAEQRFREIAEAYGVLSDPARRASYDTRGFAGLAGTSAEDLWGGIYFADIFYVTVIVDIPQQSSPRQRRLYEQLRAEDAEPQKGRDGRPQPGQASWCPRLRPQGDGYGPSLDFLAGRSVTVHVAETREAVKIYNDLEGSAPVAGLFHSTCAALAEAGTS
jgi:DnaJ-class molecular chaperone